MLSSKDLLITQLQVQAGKLWKENEKLTVLAGGKRKISSLKESSKLLKVPTKPRSQLSSDSGCENPGSDNTSLFDESNEVQSGRFTSPRSTLQKPYVFCTTLQFCYVFYTTFSFSPFALILERCTKYIESIQRCKFSMHFLQGFNKHKKKCNVAHTACILCNVL